MNSIECRHFLLTIAVTLAGWAAQPAQAFDRFELRGCCFEVIDLAVAALPEPANWSLMALGLFGLGIALRRVPSGWHG